MENDWISVDEVLPDWGDGELSLKLSNGKIIKGYYNAYRDLWEISTQKGSDKLNEVVTHYKITINHE